MVTRGEEHKQKKETKSSWENAQKNFVVETNHVAAMVMEELTVLQALLPTLVVGMVAALLLLKLLKGRKLPPGPRKLPIIGHLHLLGKVQHIALYNLSRVHGPLMWLQLGSQSVIVVSASGAARQILQTHDQIFSSRPRLSVPSSLHGCRDILFASPANPHWKFLRQLCFNHLFSKKQLEAFCPLRAQEVRTLLSSILLSAGTPITLIAHTHALAGNIICRMAFGKRLPDLASSSQAHPSHNVTNLTVEMNNLLGAFNVSDYFPWLAWLDLQGYGRKSRDLAKKFDPVLQEIIEGHLRDRDKCNSDGSANSIKNFFDFLLDAAARPEDDNKNGPISYDNVKAVTMNMFGGGIDTSALTIEWALGELLANPTKMRKLQEELDQVVGTSRIVEESDLCCLPYLQAVVKETMRLHPVVPLLVPHLTLQECEVLGYKIPADTMACINAWAIGRDPSTWESPFEFLPERFVGKDIDVNGQYFELLPFGSGRRGCPGWMLGLVTVQIAVASLVQGFDWTIAKELDISEAYGLILTTSNPLIVQARPKLPRDLFAANI